MISNELIKLQPKSIFTVKSKPETLHVLPDSQFDVGVLNDFDSISLEEMDAVKMMNRYDSKFFLTKKVLFKVLETIKEDYFVLEIADTRVQSYNTIYFDTPDDKFYLAHHNGSSNRIKLRKREYSDSGIAFLEIKEKNNKGITRKKRMKISSLDKDLSDKEIDFLKKNTNLNGDKLLPKFGNRFKRITLVSKKLDERCTIDLDMQFHSYSIRKSYLEEIVIAELKQEKQNLKSKLAQRLKENRIYTQPFSKYCLGRAINETGLKSNMFKPGLQQIKNHLQNS